MVRTRHSGSNEDSVGSFLPHTHRRTSPSRRSGSESQEIVATIQDGHLYDSSRRSRGRTFHLGSSTSPDHTDSIVYSTRRSRLLSFSEDSDTPRVGGRSSGGERIKGSMPRRGNRQRIAISPDEASNDEEEEDDRPRRDAKKNQSLELRRSSRKRKPLYATMDQAAILGNYQYSADMFEWDTTRTRSRRSAVQREEVVKDEEPEEDGGGNDQEAEEQGGEEDQEEPEGGGEEDGGDEDEDDDEDEDEDYKEGDENNNEEEMERLDMYSRVKQRHIQARKMREAKRMLEEEAQMKEQQSSQDEEEESTEEDDSDEETSEEEMEQKNYHLREHRPLTKRFEVPVDVPMPRRRKTEIEEVFGGASSPIRRRYPKTRNHLTPIRSPRFARRMHHATHHSSSTSSEGSGDERRFERRKSKSMAKARMRCLPMNLNAEDVSTGTLRDRQKIGSSLADVDPMNIDSSITFDSVGGLSKHIQSLKEMVVFPLLYPEVFTKFKISPPRGVLFHGPPGTGKTLVARALANECRNGDKKVAFFMRKGADCLSKWVGESERQLRLLFDQAYTMRPSIIFFDEIDGLAPVRSSRQDQIHSSIVSTLLALMDGLDSRGEIVIIGATNRIDSIDPALRRPGRFDREFLFQLPSCEARKSILSIHTKDWNPKLADSFISEVAEKCVGYCGADLKALCTESAIYALRHQFPQIYASKEKLQLDLSRIQISARDFHLAMQNIVPAAQRAVVSPGRALSAVVRSLLQRQLDFLIDGLNKVFPVAFTAKKSGTPDDVPGTSKDVMWDLLNGDVYDEEEETSIFEPPNPWKKRRTDEGPPPTFLKFSGSSFSAPSTFRPRLLIIGDIDQGHSTYIAPALLHHIEGIPVHCLDLPALYAVSAKNPEESCAQVFREARRTAPSVIYMPHIVQWWNASGYTLQATFLTLLHDLPPSTPILLLATADCPIMDIPNEIKSIFCSHQEKYTMRNPTTDERKVFFTELIIYSAAKPPPKKKKIAAKALEALPVAQPTEPRKLTEDELSKLRESEEATLRELRIFLREVLARLAHERKFRTFTKAVDPEEVPDYFVVIKRPMDLSTMLNKINMHQYTSGKDFLADIDQITINALEYNPDIDPSDRQIRNYACELKDMAHAIIDAEMDPDFERMCCEIAKSRQERGDVVNSKDAPSCFRTLSQLQREKAQENAKNNPTPVVRHRTYPRVPMSPFRAIKRRRSSAWSRGFLPKKKYPQKKKDDPKAAEEGGGEEEELERENPEIRGVQRRVIKRKRRSTWSRGFISKPKKKKRPLVEEAESDDKAGEEVDGAGEGAQENDRGSDDQQTKEQEPVADGSVEQQDGEEGDKQEEQEGVKPAEEEQTANGSEGDQCKANCESEDQGRKSGEDTDEYFDEKDQAVENHSAKDADALKELSDTGDVSMKESSGTGGNEGLTNGIEASDDDSIKSAPVERKEWEEQADEVNGDDHEGSDEGKEKDTAVGEEAANQEEISVNADDSMKMNRTAAIPLRRVTRRMLAEVHTTRALQILEEPEQELVIDMEKLQGLLDSVVVLTTNWTVSRLEMLHCRLSQGIYRHRMDYDKGALITEMEETVQSVLTMH